MRVVLQRTHPEPHLMKTTGTVITLIIALAVAGGCKKEESQGYSPTPTTSDPVRAIITDARMNATQIFTVNASFGGVFVGSHVTVLTFAPHAFRDHQGGVVNGVVTIDLMEVMSVSEMVRTNIRTVAIANGTKYMLESGGAVRLRATASGEQVTVAPGAAMVNFPANALDPAMLQYAGVEDGNGDVLWQDPVALAADSAIFLPDSAGGWITGKYYNAPRPAGNFGSSTWPPYDFINCDHPIPPGGDSTDVTINLPVGFANNTMVWVVLPAINCMVYLEASSATGIRAGFPVRVGLQGTIVALSQQNGQYYSSFTPITIAMDHEQAITMQPTSLSQYQADLDVL